MLAWWYGITFSLLHSWRCQPAPVSISFPSTYRIHVRQLLSYQVGLKRQEVIVDLKLHFLLHQAERTVAMETNWKQANTDDVIHKKSDINKYNRTTYKKEVLITISVIHAGLSLQLLQQTLCSPKSLRSWQCPAQVVHQPVETGVVRRLLEVFGTLVQPGTQGGCQSAVETPGKEKKRYRSRAVHMEQRVMNIWYNVSHFLMALLVSELWHLPVSCSLSSTLPYLKEKIGRAHLKPVNM